MCRSMVVKLKSKLQDRIHVKIPTVIDAVNIAAVTVIIVSIILVATVVGPTEPLCAVQIFQFTL